MSSDMQFEYKSQHTTALCRLVYFETLQYYTSKQNGSQVYSCVLDAIVRPLIEYIMGNYLIF